MVAVAVCVLCAPVALAAPQSRETLAHRIDAALRPGVEAGATVSVRIVDARTGEELLATPNAADAFTPASNLKLVTSATALDLYGPDYELTTTLARLGDDLWVIGSGDPALGDPKLAERDGRTPMSVLDGWADALKKHGVTNIAGDIVVCDPVFDDELTHPTWHSGNLLHWYGAPVAGVSFNDNCVDFTFTPGAKGKPAKVETLPPAGGFVVEGTVVTDAQTHNPKLDKKPATPGAADEPVFVVGGSITKRYGPSSKPVNDPRRFLGETLRAVLVRHGITVAGRVRVTTDDAPAVPDDAVIATHVTPLTDVLGRVDTNSQNMMAEALAKLNGLAHNRTHGVEHARGSWGSGHLAAVAFLKDAGIDTTVLVAADGSGLSHENRVSARLLSDLLLHMLLEHEHGEHFVNAMAISGVRGSVRSRMKEIKGRVYAKTGTISGVSALSGYVFARNGHVAVFSILHNHVDGSQGPYRKQQDAAVLALYRWLQSQGRPRGDDATPTQPMREAMEKIGVR